MRRLLDYEKAFDLRRLLTMRRLLDYEKAFRL